VCAMAGVGALMALATGRRVQGSRT
jgi:hypothetical protein